MKKWTMHRGGGACGVAITGENLVDAIEKNFREIAREAEIGNAAGYQLVNVTSRYQEGILGGQGGVEVKIRSTGMPLVNGNTGPENVKSVFIAATPEDMPHEHVHNLK